MSLWLIFYWLIFFLFELSGKMGKAWNKKAAWNTSINDLKTYLGTVWLTAGWKQELRRLLILILSLALLFIVLKHEVDKRLVKLGECEHSCHSASGMSSRGSCVKPLVLSCEWKTERKKERAWLLLGMVEEKGYYRYVGEHSVWGGTHVQSGHDRTELGHVRRDGGRERRGEKRGTKCSSQEVKGTKKVGNPNDLIM